MGKCLVKAYINYYIGYIIPTYVFPLGLLAFLWVHS